MKKRIILVIFSIFLLILDNTLTPFMGIKGAWPNLLFTFSIAYSIINGKNEGVIIGLISGFLQDIFFFNILGVNLIVNMLCCLIAGAIGDGIWRDKKLVPVVTIFFGTIVKYISIAIIFYILNIDMGILRGIYVAIYNSIVMLLTYNLILKFFDREDMRKAWRF